MTDKLSEMKERLANADEDGLVETVWLKEAIREIEHWRSLAPPIAGPGQVAGYRRIEEVVSDLEKQKVGPTYVTVRSGEVAKTHEVVAGRVFVDEDEEGQLVGVEILTTVKQTGPPKEKESLRFGLTAVMLRLASELLEDAAGGYDRGFSDDWSWPDYVTTAERSLLAHRIVAKETGRSPAEWTEKEKEGAIHLAQSGPSYYDIMSLLAGELKAFTSR